MAPVDFGFFELYGLKPVAGRFFQLGSGGDNVLNPPAPQADVHYVVNQIAVRRLGYATPEAAIGQKVRFGFGMGPPPPDKLNDHSLYWAMNGTIIGVVRDFTFIPGLPPAAPTDTVIPSTVYSVGSTSVNLPDTPAYLHVKLKARDIPETLTAIDAAWKQSGQMDPIDRTFFDPYVQAKEIAVERQGQAFAIFAVIAMLMACLGLFGVAQFIAARRTKEIGIRKAMGATRADAVALLLWQFFKPVLMANVIAWPLAWLAMNRWLSGFADHVPLSLWIFPAAGAVAVAIAFSAVAGQAWLVARQKPVLALRYE
jgi:putative ABC transport system permease protein